MCSATLLPERLSVTISSVMFENAYGNTTSTLMSFLLKKAKRDSVDHTQSQPCKEGDRDYGALLPLSKVTAVTSLAFRLQSCERLFVWFP